MVQERPVRVERRLAAILAADVAAYSRLMHNNEEATHAQLNSLLTDCVAPAISEHSGRIVKNTGDGFLAEFPSAVGAVRAALQFQNRVKELTAADTEDRRIAFRVGINVGDVIIEQHDIFGDGVNIAARLEGIAEPGGICISASAYDQVLGKVEVEFADLGDQNLKNIARAIRAYATLPNRPSPAIPPIGIEATLPPPLSIVVLPFSNLSGDAKQDYFVDGVTESLTTDLSRITGSFVIGRHTAFTYKGMALDIKKIGRELNVRYVLEGSVQRSGKRLRVNVQLVDAETANHLWSDRFDKPLADLFDLQDEIVARLASMLNAELNAAEARRAERSAHPNSMDLLFQGKASWNKGPTLPNMTEARGFFERALALDPRNVQATVGVAGVDLAMGAAHLADDRAAFLSAAEANAIRALSFIPDHAEAHLILGHVNILANRAAQGIAECEQALMINRNLASAHSLIGFAKYCMGRAVETEGHVREAVRLSPRDTNTYWWMFCVGLAKMQLGAYAEAAHWLRRSIEANRNFPVVHFHLASALALSGSLDPAHTAVQEGLARLPDFTLRRFQAHKSSDNPSYLAGFERICEGMRMAGVPEG
jgi:TolB-like protein/class 3 adenylate cyclase